MSDGKTGFGEATEAFTAAIDAESPSRSRQGVAKHEPPQQMGVDDLFPRREMDRSEPEGGGDDVPEVVKRRQRLAPDDGPPRDPTEGTDEDEDVEGDEEEPDDQEPEEEEDEEEERAAGALDLDQIVEVTVDGEATQVSLKEALGGYIRTETFHRRLNELSQGVEALQSQRNEMSTYQQALVERATALEEYVAEFMPKEPDWEALYAADPGQAARHERRWRTFIGQVEGLKQKREATQRELAAERARNLNNFATANRSQMIQKHPEWKNEKVWKRDHESMRRSARSLGYSDQEIDQLYDARGVEALYKVAAYDRLMASKPRPVRGIGSAPKRNGVTPQRGNMSSTLDRAEKRLSRTGSLRDAEAVFARILERER